MPIEPATAAALVRRCQRDLPGDTRAFEELVAAYKGRVFAIAYRVVGDQQEAEDQAQEVFLKVFRNLKQLDDPLAFTAWVNRITVNTCLEALAAQRRRPQTKPLTGPDDAGDEPRYADLRTATPEEAAMRREMRRCLERTLAGLDVQARASIVLRDIEGRSYQEIADTLALGMSAVKMRIHRARLSFQQLLERVCPELARRDDRAA